jgi:glyoxylase-like metal-dependent hydrolase (beta-lactamase superfamily II)
MNTTLAFVSFVFIALLDVGFAVQAQDLGPGFHKIKDGIYTFAPDQATTTCNFVITEAGVVMIDSCNSPLDSRRMVAAIKKVTDKPVMFLIDTETHADHTANHFIFSPPATVINHEGAGEGMRKVIASYKLMKSLNPEVVIAGHGQPTTTIIFDEYEGFYDLLMKRVGEMTAQGKSLNDIKKELKMPEYADWRGQDRLGVNVDAAYRSVKK